MGVRRNFSREGAASTFCSSFLGWLFTKRFTLSTPQRTPNQTIWGKNNWLVYLTITTYVRRIQRITNGTRSGRTTLQDYALSSWHRHPHLGVTLPRTAWVRLNHLHIAVGCVRSCLYKWVWPSLRYVSVAQKNKSLTMLSSIVQVHRPPHGLHGLTIPDDETIEWMLNTCPEI